MNHYILTGYQTQHTNTYPCVKIYGIYNNLNSAIDEITNYTYQNIEINEQEGSNTISGNGYILWIKKIPCNHDLWNMNGTCVNNCNTIKIKVITNSSKIPYEPTEYGTKITIPT
uniref:Uncharacterized protein n=1 Tax=viral metagenome TaxID=1070528 RepID=A0A6C0KZV8_9ZZZZ|tara:strand:- start:6646 stop:6987 length:342 start_codon:yes stop_codon:yes gene_type:complete